MLAEGSEEPCPVKQIYCRQREDSLESGELSESEQSLSSCDICLFESELAA